MGFRLQGEIPAGTKTRDILCKFLKTGKVQPSFPAFGKYYKNICYLNKTRKIATELCCNNFVKNKKHYNVNFRYGGKIETYKVTEGMPVLVTQNLKKINMYNMMEFKIDEIEDETDEEDEIHISYKINGEWLNSMILDIILSLHFVLLCINTRVPILKSTMIFLDVSRRNKKQLYTCLSRTTNYEYIHLDNTFLNSITYFN